MSVRDRILPDVLGLESFAAEVEEDRQRKETVDHPSHYNAGSIEVIDAIEDWGLGFHEGNVVKYVARARHKGKELEDLKKARWYLDRLISRIEKRNR